MGKISAICFFVAGVVVFARLPQGSIHFYPILYMLLLVSLTVVPMLIIKKREISFATGFIMFPTLLVSLDTFFLRQGLFNIFAYIDGSLFHRPLLKSIEKATVLVLIGNLTLWLGFFWPASRRAGERLGRKMHAWTSFDVSPRTDLIFLAFFIGIFARLLGIKLGVLGYFSALDLIKDASLYIEFLKLLESLSTLSVIAYFCVQLRQDMPKWLAFLAMFLIELVTLLFIGFKGQIIYRFFYLAVAYVFIRGKFYTSMVVAGILLLILITPINLGARAQFWEGGISVGKIGDIQKAFLHGGKRIFAAGGIMETMASSFETIIRYSAQLECLSVVVDYADRTGTRFYGKHYLHIFIWPIPRAIWPSKPVIDSKWVAAEAYGLGRLATTSIAQTVPGDFYINFGLPAVVIGFFMFGALQRSVSTGLLQIVSLRFIPAIPAIVFTLAQPQSNLGPQIGGAIRNTIFNLIVLSLMFPKTKQHQMSSNQQDSGDR